MNLYYRAIMWLTYPIARLRSNIMLKLWNNTVPPLKNWGDGTDLGVDIFYKKAY